MTRSPLKPIRSQITVLSLNWKIILFDDLVNLDLKHNRELYLHGSKPDAWNFLSAYNYLPFAWTGHSIFVD